MGADFDATTLVGLSFEKRDSIARYSELMRGPVGNRARLEAIQPIVDLLLEGLPGALRIMTVAHEPVIGGPAATMLYFNYDEWREHGEVCHGFHQFYGDGAIVAPDGTLVVIDSYSGSGVSVGTTVTFIDLSDDCNRYTGRGSSPEIHELTLMHLADTPPKK